MNTFSENFAKKVYTGGFLQSREWADFQKAVGRNVYEIDDENMPVFAIEHRLPMVGGYFYVPRWPKSAGSNQESAVRKIQNMIDISKTNNSSWIRIEPENDKMLQLVKKNVDYKIKKAPHDMQPRENFIIDIAKTEQELLADMKSKTRYNIRLAKKQGVEIVTSGRRQGQGENYVEEFLKLTKQMALRQGIKTHLEEYYRKMVESLPKEMLKIYAAKYGGKIIAANLVLFYENVATYLHGASGNEHRNVMAPHILHWQAILDAKERGCRFYDFGGVKISNKEQAAIGKSNSWEGITRFKLGFSQKTKPVVFPGSYDIVINQWRYWLYRTLQYIKALILNFKQRF
ncbi:MAG: lipid II:glycine glycyltransferase FemX [Patescibacteria group bacterium]|jgi:peptidoglycan pentaglycine glycine transferase (the first glycine)|nr:peptidoglycan bridge formation glycyltransferase FemA/FemB family protein [Candidatus Moranbacteria bacterium]